ncbi:MAG: heterocyst frequency control protein PatD [Cyanobacteriota bacterium]
MHKQMRLLQTDVMLLLSSRRSATSQRRTSEVRNRLNTLIQYCEALLQL